MCRCLEVGKRFEAELVVQPFCQSDANAWHRGQESNRIGLATQTFQHREPPRYHQLANGAGDRVTDCWQGLESVQTLSPKDLIHRQGVTAHHHCGAPIGPYSKRISTLLAKEPRSLFEPSGHLEVDRMSHDGCARTATCRAANS